MNLVVHIVLAWIAVCGVATFGWVSFVELCRARERRNMSGSVRLQNDKGRDPTAHCAPTEPDTTLRAVVRSPGRPAEEQRRKPPTTTRTGSDSVPSAEPRATARDTLKIVR